MNLRRDCSNEEINKRYRELCKKMHPDKGGKLDEFQKLQISMAIIRLYKGYSNDKQVQEEEEHQPKEVKLNVLYFNARSINPTNEKKIEFLKNRIESLKPDIVAITETWLKNEINQDFTSKLSLQDYAIYRCDREDKNEKNEIRRGGGILIAVKTSINLEHKLINHYYDNYMCSLFNYVFNCQKCSKAYSHYFLFCLVYRRGNLYKNQKVEHFEKEDDFLLGSLLNIANNNLSSLFVGDFNFKINCDKSQETWVNTWLKIPTTLYNLLNGRAIYEGIKQDYVIKKQNDFYKSMIEKGYKQLVADATIGNGNILDLIFARPDLFVENNNIKNLGHIPSEMKNNDEDEEIDVKGSNLDHVMLYFSLNIGTDCNKQLFL